LIAITRREQVAQIFGKSIYVVTDVALVPLSSQSEAEKGVAAAVLQMEATADTDEDSSDTESTVDESNDVNSAADIQEVPSPLTMCALNQTKIVPLLLPTSQRTSSLGEDRTGNSHPNGLVRKDGAFLACVLQTRLLKSHPNRLRPQMQP
jgi:hypothetical protein